MTGGGARSNLFQVELPLPPAIAGGDAVAASQKLTFTCRSTIFPGSTVTSIPVPYFGRTVNFAGTRTFEEWSVTVLNDEDFLVYDAINAWSNSINTHEGNLRASGPNPNSYQASADVVQFGKRGDEIKRITLVNLWPASIQQMDLSWDAADAIQDFSVSWVYDYWVNAGVTS